MVPSTATVTTKSATVVDAGVEELMDAGDEMADGVLR